MTFPLRILISAAALLFAGSAHAGPGHDHGDAAPASSAAAASPRFEAHSNLFEAVGILHKDELSVFIDRYADNAPVLKAKVDLESGGVKAAGRFHDEHGDYSFSASAFQKPGTYPVTLTIASGNDADILAGNLVVPDPHAGHVHGPAWAGWLYAALAVAAVGVVAALLLRRRQGRLNHV